MEDRVQLNGASGGLQIGVDEATANILYQDFENDAMVPSGWNGDVAAGNAGTLSPQYLAAIQDAINDLRWMAGLPGTVTLNPTWDAEDQQAALIESASHALEEDDPSSSLPDYTQAGADGLTHSNNQVDAAGTGALLDFMAENGLTNNPTGHRRSILDPLVTTMGWGEISNATPSPDFPAVAANYIGEFQGDNELSGPITGVAWPPNGYFPLPWLPSAVPGTVYVGTIPSTKWSFQLQTSVFDTALNGFISVQTVDFTSASLTVTQNGVVQPVTILNADSPSSTQYGLSSALVWTLPSTATGEQPAVYSVNINNVLVNGAPQNFTYTVTTFAPTPTTATLPSQVEFLTPTNQTDPGSSTSTVTLARSLNVDSPLSVIVQGGGTSQEVDFAAGQIYATATLPTGTLSLTDPQGGIIAPGGGMTQVEIASGGSGGGAGGGGVGDGGSGVETTQPAVFVTENPYKPSPTKKVKHPKSEIELSFSGPINQSADVNPSLYLVQESVRGKGKKRPSRVIVIPISVTPGPDSSSLLISEKLPKVKGAQTLTGTGLTDANGLTITTFTSPL